VTLTLSPPAKAELFGFGVIESCTFFIGPYYPRSSQAPLKKFPEVCQSNLQERSRTGPSPGVISTGSFIAAPSRLRGRAGRRSVSSSTQKLIQIGQIVIVGNCIALIGDRDRLVDVLKDKLVFFQNQLQEELYL
jgi:hypothetical protein